jgi:hypothetical protein
LIHRVADHVASPRTLEMKPARANIAVAKPVRMAAVR